MWMYIKVFWAWLTGFLHFHVKKRCVEVPEWSVTSIRAVDDVTNEYRGMSTLCDLETWEDDVQRYLGWENPRVDVKYIHTSPFGVVTKYRMILRPGDPWTFPPEKQQLLALRGIISATLVPHAHISDAREVDVTRRLKKYAGPNKDFYEGRVRVLDCFPFDDPVHLAERFESLHVLDTSRLLSQEKHVFKLKSNDRLQIL
jgi:hypothetical protein